jgi:hypothetical protein
MRNIALSGLRLTFVAGFLLIGKALAGESQLELTTGGLDFGAAANPSALALLSEDIRLSPKSVQIRYELVNAGAEPLELPYAFKFPELDYFDPDVDYAIPGSDPVNFLGVSLRVDGKLQPLKLVQKATLDGKDVSGFLREAKINLVPLGGFQTQLAQADAAQREKLKQSGLIVEAGTSADGAPIYTPTWTVKTGFSGKLKLSPGQTTTVELKYLPSLGSSPDTVLRKSLRDQSGLGGEVARRRSDFCVDNVFLAGLDKMSGDNEANEFRIAEKRIVVRTGHQGAGLGPARAYKLLVDKENPKALISFCAANLKAIGKTQFEARSSDTTPTGDLKILIIEGNRKPPANPQ